MIHELKQSSLDGKQWLTLTPPNPTRCLSALQRRN